MDYKTSVVKQKMDDDDDKVSEISAGDTNIIDFGPRVMNKIYKIVYDLSEH